jgi:hypothetical protein
MSRFESVTAYHSSSVSGENHKKARTVAAMHYPKRSDSFQSRHEAGAGYRRVGNGELQIDVARRGANTRQDAPADSASYSSAHFAGASIVRASARYR